MRLSESLAGKGRFGDTMLAHISPEEAALLKAHGGSGTINPETGLPEYWKFKNFWKALRDTTQTAAVLGGNYLLPGSSMLTSKIVSDGSQEQLGSTIGKVAQIGTGLAGSGVGSSVTGIKSAADAGYGWTNAANGLGSFAGAPTLGTDISTGLSSALSGVGNAASSVGEATGISGAGSKLSDLLRGAGSALGLSGEGGLFSGSVADGVLGSAGVDMQAPSSVGSSFIKNSGLGSALSTSAGGGSSSYGGLGAALIGGANDYFSTEKSRDEMLDSQNRSLNALSPYLRSGERADAKLSDRLIEGFDPSNLENDPGFKFNLEQGQKSLDRNNAARGGFYSGAALKEAGDFTTNLANNYAKDQYSMWADQNNQLAGQAGRGLTATGAAGADFDDIGNANSSTTLRQGKALSSLLTGGGRYKTYRDRFGNPAYAY